MFASEPLFANADPLLYALHTEAREVAADSDQEDAAITAVDILLEIWAETDAKVESTENEVRLPGDCVLAGPIELMEEPGMLDDRVVAEARDVFDDSIPKVVAREVMIKLSNKVQRYRYCIIEERTV